MKSTIPFYLKCRLPSRVGFVFLIILASFAVSFQTGCSSIGVKRVDRQEWILENTDTALTTGNISRRVRDYLALHGLDGAFDDEPRAVLAKLAEIFRKTEDNETLDALIELCFYHAENSSGEERTSAHLSAAYYAYVSLFQGLPGLPPDSPYEPRYLFNCRFYDHSVAGFLLDLQNSGISFDKPFELPLVDGRMVKFSQAESTLPLPLSDYATFLNCFGYMPEGLNTYSRRAGLGAPLIPVKKQFPADDVKEEGSSLGGMFPATLFIRFAQPFSMEGSPEAVMEFHDTTKDEFVDVGDKKVPLELDISTPFAYFLRSRPVIVRGIYYLLNPGGMKKLQGLYMLTPYDPEKIPVVLVHGLMSNPRTWAQVYNTVLSDPEIRRRFQFWYFTYPTGDPIYYSASVLRKSLDTAKNKYDPQGTNPNFKQMVVLSHSMGGLLAEQMAMDSSPETIEKIFMAPINELEISEEYRSFLIDVYVFKRLPFVARVIFICTPHRGAGMAS